MLDEHRKLNFFHFRQNSGSYLLLMSFKHLRVINGRLVVDGSIVAFQFERRTIYKITDLLTDPRIPYQQDMNLIFFVVAFVIVFCWISVRTSITIIYLTWFGIESFCFKNIIAKMYYSQYIGEFEPILDENNLTLIWILHHLISYIYSSLSYHRHFSRVFTDLKLMRTIFFLHISLNILFTGSK